jgi:hypothetical protein
MRKIIFVLNTKNQAIIHGNILKVTAIIRRVLIRSAKALSVKIRTIIEDKT